MLTVVFTEGMIVLLGYSVACYVVSNLNLP